MSRLHVTIVADGRRREFVGDGDGAAVVAAFRTWLHSPDCVLPMVDGADALDAAAADLDHSAQTVESLNGCGAQDAETDAKRPGEASVRPGRKPVSRTCRQCGVRWAQGNAGLCRWCARGPGPAHQTLEAGAGPRALRSQLLAEAFSVDDEFELPRLLSCVGNRTVAELQQELNAMVQDGLLRVRTIGTHRRWRRVQTGADGHP